MLKRSAGSRFLKAQADHCRRHAADLNGTPEGPFLLRMAGYFEDLATHSAELTAQGHSAAGLELN